MVQFYLLSVLYLILAAGLLLVDKYGAQFLFLINLKTFFKSKKSIQISSIVAGFVIASGLVFFPVAPGPMVIGDLLPAINIVIVIVYYLNGLGKETDAVVDYNNGKKSALGFATLGVALIHFLFPGIVIV